jgi:hypothetical protein
MRDDYTRNQADPDAIVSLDVKKNLGRMTAEQFLGRKTEASA